jgi:selenide,water dikinase
VLFLTKPLGFGVTTTALKQEKAKSSDVVEVVNWMKMLNREAARLATEMNLRGGTDVTGFSLLGHGMEMAEASSVRLRLHNGTIPFTSGAQFYANLGTFPGGAVDNKLFFGARVEFQGRFTEEEIMLLFDPQTSGGLLLAVPKTRKKEFLEQADSNGIPAWEIGEVLDGSGLEVIK